MNCSQSERRMLPPKLLEYSKREQLIQNVPFGFTPTTAKAFVLGLAKCTHFYYLPAGWGRGGVEVVFQVKGHIEHQNYLVEFKETFESEFNYIMKFISNETLCKYHLIMYSENFTHAESTHPQRQEAGDNNGGQFYGRETVVALVHHSHYQIVPNLQTIFTPLK